MGVKWTCTLIFLSGIVYLGIEATSFSQHAESEISLQQAVADEEPSVGESFPMDRKKRETTHVVNDDGKGNRQESTSFSDGNGSGFASSWSSSSGTGGGSGVQTVSSGSGSAAVGSRSAFSQSEDSQPRKSGEDLSHDGSKERNSSEGDSREPDLSRSNIPVQDGAQSGFKGTEWGFGGPNFGRPDNQQFATNVGSFPNNYPYQNPASFNAPGVNFEDLLEQYFRNIEEQQRQLFARIHGPYQPRSSSWAHATAFMTSPNGGVHPNARSYSNSWSSTPIRSAGQTSRGAGHTMRQHNRAVNNRRRFFDMNNAIEYGSPVNNYYPNRYGFASRGGFGAASGNFDHFNQGFPNRAGGGFPNFYNQPQDGNGAFASASYGPNGGFREAEVRPGSPDITSRFAEEAPPPSGQTYGVFTSSSSHSETGADGKERHYNQATTGINDNGKISYHTVHDR